MLAERLARLLGSILALATLMGGALLLDEPPTFATTGYDWTANISDVTVVSTTGEGPADDRSQAAHALVYGAI